MQQNIPYIVKFRVTNLAGLSINEESSPILYDLSTPTAGKVVDGSDFLNDRVWFSSSTTISGKLADNYYETGRSHITSEKKGIICLFFHIY